MPPLEGPRRPRPRPKPPKPIPKPLIPVHGKPSPEQEHDGIPPGGVPFLKRPVACATYRLCPPARPATVHLRSGQLPTPFIALSVAVLALSAVLLIALLVRWLVRRRRRELEQDVLPPLAQDDEESVQGVDAVTGGVVLGEEDEEEDEEVDDDGGVHHVWYIRTKGLDERAIAAIAAVVFDATKRGAGGYGGGCAVCLAEFRDGETLRLLPRCRHAFHRGCIDPWLRAHVNCPLCRAPVQATPAEEDAGARTEEAVPPERAAATVTTTPPRPVACPVASLREPASSSAREEDTTELAKIARLLCLKFSDAGVGAGGSVSFGHGSCQQLPITSGSSAAAGVDVQEIE